MLNDSGDRAWLAAMPAVIELEEITLGHSGFADPGAYGYVTNAREASAEIAAFRTRWGFIGHTHVPAIWRQTPGGAVKSVSSGAALGRGTRATVSATISLKPAGRYLINPGSVGQPRDRDPRAACAILDLREGTLEQIRIPYDVASAQDAIRRRGLPLFEAARLARGM